MAPSILATFKLSPEQWEAFKARANDRDTNASQVLKRLVAEYLEGHLDEYLDTGIDAPNRIDGNLDARIDQRIDERLKHLDVSIDRRIDLRLKHLDAKTNRIDQGVDQPKKRIAA